LPEFWRVETLGDESIPSGKVAVVAEFNAQILTEIRDEAREARAETHESFRTVFHRLSLVETRLGLVETGVNDLKQRLTSLERHIAALLAGCSRV
jgi:hypothetical protein